VIPRHEFESVAKRHHSGAKLRSIRRWDQFLALATAQLTGRTSLRDAVANFNAQFRRLYHLGAKPVARASLSRVNRDQPASLFEELFHRLLARTQGSAPKHRFRFKAPLISLDASHIEMTMALFPWAKYQATKGAIKLHVGLNHDGFLPQFVAVSEGKQHEIHWARTLDLPADSVVVFDRGFFDYKFFNQLNQNKIRFITRLKKDIRYTVIERRKVDKKKGLTCDQTIRLKGNKAKRYGLVLRRVGYRDPETGKHYFFLTNATNLAASTIAQVYRDRWQIELFFKWIKQNLKIKSFVGTSPNAVMTQIWIAMCVYLMLAYLKFLNAAGWSMSEIIRLLQLNLFQKRSLQELLRPPDLRPPPPSPQMCLGIGG
jgi:putative transposase